jgi:DNA-binding transcriptional LysR family regulator
MVYIDFMNINKVDLNLLSALDVLLELRSVSRAAKQLNITQPAMSNALARMRELLDDELLVRSGREMLVTPRAERLQAKLRSSLQQLERDVLRPVGFDPRTWRQTFSVGFHDYEQLLILPSLEESWSGHYPGLAVHCKTPASMDSFSELRSGALDVATGRQVPNSGEIYHKRLLKDRFVCLVWNGNRVVRNSLTVSTYASLSHIFIAPHGSARGEADERLAELGIERMLRFALPQFSVVPWMLLNSQLVATLPERIAQRFAEVFPVKIVECPLKLSDFSIYLLWHERTHKSPAHVWMRDQIVKSCS